VGARGRKPFGLVSRYYLNPNRLTLTRSFNVPWVDAYRTYLARAKRALSAGSFPTTSLGLIEQDIRGTLPSLHIFNPDSGAMYADLKDMLCAWVVSRSDEQLGYVPGTARIAAMILLNMSAGPGFVLMKNLLERHCMRSFYGGISTKDDVRVQSAA
jgi:TBC1 domain family member 14